MIEKILILIVLILVHNSAVNGNLIFRDSTKYLGGSCILSDGFEGICQKRQNCAGLERELLNQRKFKQVIQCGFEGRDPIFCCPKAEKFSTYEFKTQLHPLLCENSAKPKIRLTQNIIGGVMADVGEFPHQVALGYETDSQKEYEFNCGGSIISEKIILTAAHCVHSQKRKPVIVRLGRVGKPSCFV